MRRSAILSGRRALSSLSGSSISPSASPSSIESAIRHKLSTELAATHIELEDTSGGCGTFFRLFVVSPKFSGLARVQQHRLINAAIRTELTALHGLTLQTLSADEWRNKTAK